MKERLIIFAIILMLPLPFFSQDKKMLKAAQKGNVESQVWLGNYFLGRGHDGDALLSVEWYRKAAAQGYDRAQYLLGYCYENGVGVDRDSTVAIQWYEKAAEKHNLEAISALNKLQNKIIISSNDKGNHNIDSFTVEPSKLEVSPKQSKDTHEKILSDVEMNIPSLSQTNINTFAIIIANEDYQREAKVDFAENDGKIFKAYCNKVLGMPEKNVHLVINATLNNMIYELDWLEQVCQAYKGEASVIFYYAGHGLPDESTGQSYLLPADGIGRNLKTCLSIKELYSIIGRLSAKNVTVIMDACFSGAKRSGQMLTSARGIAIKVKPSTPQGKMVVLSAAQGDETAYCYKEQQHGLFTYFLLRKLKETEGNATLGELSKYVEEQVSRYSIVENGKIQTPTVVPSTSLGDSWKNLKLR